MTCSDDIRADGLHHRLCGRPLGLLRPALDHLCPDPPLHPFHVADHVHIDDLARLGLLRAHLWPVRAGWQHGVLFVIGADLQFDITYPGAAS